MLIKFFVDWVNIYLFPLHKKMKFFIKDFFSKCDQIRSFLRIWSHLLNKSIMENCIFCAASHRPGWRQFTNSTRNGFMIEYWDNSSIRSEIPSCPSVLLIFKFCNTLWISHSGHKRGASFLESQLLFFITE